MTDLNIARDDAWEVLYRYVSVREALRCCPSDDVDRVITALAELIVEPRLEVDRLRAVAVAVAEAADSWSYAAHNHSEPLPRGCDTIAAALGVAESHDDVTARDISTALRAMVGVSDV